MCVHASIAWHLGMITISKDSSGPGAEGRKLRVDKFSMPDPHLVMLENGSQTCHGGKALLLALPPPGAGPMAFPVSYDTLSPEGSATTMGAPPTVKALAKAVSGQGGSNAAGKPLKRRL